ncbi:hypothetical protein QFZ82_001328 [Streptomyces sp. V4I23]|nr:hypothetical protein [Streptomyces sp. V4I23]
MRHHRRAACRQALATLHRSPELLDGSAVSKDLLAIITGS